ncbi:MAG: hydroxymethylglutaryl-CoA reductase, degradative [Sandaracinus sp.]
MSDRKHLESELPGFYKLPMEERRQRIAALTGLDPADVVELGPIGHESHKGLTTGHADQMVENALGILGMPLGVCVNMRVDGKDWLLPMAVEEPSVIAACSHASKLLRTGEGIRSHVTAPIMIGQIQVLDVPDHEAARRAILADKESLLALANSNHPALLAAGGGALDIEVADLPRREANDPCGDMMVVHVVVDVRDAMGANAINSMCERLASRVAALSGGRVVLRILSNLNDRRLVTVEGRVPFSALSEKGGKGGRELAKGIEEASVFAERDPYRATTHNKGIMNGVDAVLLAFGQDFRAVEAAAHAYAAKDGRYTAMARWRVEGEHLVGRMTLPLAVGTVGGVFKVHPVVQVTRKIARIESTADLARLTAAAGLAQNLGALRALAAEGIQSGHMRLHARNVAVEAGAEGDEVLEVATRIADAKQVNARAAAEALKTLRAERAKIAAAKRPAVAATPTGLVIDFSSRTPLARKGPQRPKVPVMPEARAMSAEPRVQAPEAERPLTLSGGSMIRKLGQAKTDGNGPNTPRSFTGKVFVTGATSHLGANLVRRLVADGKDVRVLLLKGESTEAVDGLAVEKVYGDLRDIDSLERAMHGCKQAYHAAALVSPLDEIGPARERELFETKVRGTENLLRVALHLGFERVVVSTSSGADADPEALPHARLAQAVELECLQAVVEGLDVVLAAGAVMVGPNDYAISRMGRLLVDHAQGRLRAYVPGGLPLLSASDAAEGHVRTMARGRIGQKYVLATQFLTVDEIMDVLEEVTGRRRPRLKLPVSVMASVAEVTSFLAHRLPTEGAQPFGPTAVRVLGEERSADIGKARSELGFEPTSLRRALHDAYADLARRGLVTARAGAGAEAPPPRRTETLGGASTRAEGA